jgi:hypothetical protein
MVAAGKQSSDVAGGIEGALTLYFGRMRRQHRRHETTLQGFGDLAYADTGLAEIDEAARQTAILCRSILLVDDATPDVVPIFGEVGQKREITEGPDDRKRFTRAEGLKQPIEIDARALIGVSPIGDGQLPDGFHDSERSFTIHLADIVPQEFPKQSHVVEKRLVLGCTAGVAWK